MNDAQAGKVRPHGPHVQQFHLTVDSMICAVAKAPSSRLAVTGPVGDVTWAQLSAGSAQVAEALAREEVGRGCRVAVIARRSPLISLFVAGILHAGAAYCPLDIDAPGDRLRWQLEDLKPDLVIVIGDGGSAASDIKNLVAGPVIWEIHGTEPEQLPHLLNVPAGAVLGEPNPEIQPEDPCYITYTSGSTGRPKAVVNHHRGVACHLEWFGRLLGGGEELRVLHKAPAVFDVGIAEILNPLANGGTVVIPEPQWWMGDIDGFLDLMVDCRISVLSIVPSMLATLVDVMDDIGESLGVLSGLRHLLLGGEAVPSELALRCVREIGCRVHGLYGPTEAAMDVLWVEYEESLLAEEAFDNEGHPLLGLPQDNVTVYLRAEDGTEISEVGIAGELCIAGPQVASGYWGREDLTTQVFVPSWHPERDGGRMYRTGDLARWNGSGLLEFLGRVGDQVKIRGNRVELGEVDEALRRIPGVRQAASRLVGDGSPILAGYVVWKEPGDLGEGAGLAELKGQLRKLVPEYMIPSVIVPLSALPLNANGKLDRRALPKPGVGEC